MFKHKLHFERYNNSLEFIRALHLYFKDRERHIEAGWIYFNLYDSDLDFFSDFGLDLVIEANV